MSVSDPAAHLREELRALERAYTIGHHGLAVAGRRAGLVDACLVELFERAGVARRAWRSWRSVGTDGWSSSRRPTSTCSSSMTTTHRSARPSTRCCTRCGTRRSPSGTRSARRRSVSQRSSGSTRGRRCWTGVSSWATRRWRIARSRPFGREHARTPQGSRAGCAMQPTRGGRGSARPPTYWNPTSRRGAAGFATSRRSAGSRPRSGPTSRAPASSARASARRSTQAPGSWSAPAARSSC